MKKSVSFTLFICLTLYLLFGLGNDRSIWAQTTDPGQPGPYAVTLTEYNYGITAFVPSGFPAPVELIASVTYPTDLSNGPFPLIVFLHGRHSTCYSGESVLSEWPCPPGYTSIPSYQGYNYLANIIASHGYIVVSISANGINAWDEDPQVTDDGMLARAELIQKHLDIWNTFNTTGDTPFGTTFVGKVNLQNVGTMGHSRGGEGVVQHFLYNKSLNSPYTVRAVLPLAATNKLRNVINQVPLGLILPYCDGDVVTLEGVHYFDDTRYNAPGDVAPKHTFLVMGANHNLYNTVWTPGLGYPAFDDWNDNPYFTGAPDAHCGTVPGNHRLTAAQQQGTAIAYVTGFFRVYVGDESAFIPMLIGDASPPPSAMTSEIFTSYHAPDVSWLRRDVNRLMNSGNLTVNTLGGSVSKSGFTPYDLCGGIAPQPYKCLTGTTIYPYYGREPHTSGSLPFGGPRGLSQLRGGWSSSGGTVAYWNNSLPVGSRNVSGFQRLQFRVSVNFQDIRNSPGIAQDFKVVLTDGSLHQVTVKVSDWSEALYYPPGTVSNPSPVPKVVLNMVRIPLKSFQGINLTDIRSIQFTFDQTASGALLISDLAFASAPNATPSVCTFGGTGQSNCLVGYWKLEEATGVLRADSTGRGNSLTPYNGVGQVVGQQGNAAQFVASSMQYLEHLDNPDLSTGATSFTWAMWVNLTSKGDFKTFVDKETEGSWEYAVWYSGLTTDRFLFGIPGVTINANSLGSPQTNTWYFIVAWYDLSAKTLNIQVNNRSIDIISAGTLVPPNTIHPLRIGDNNHAATNDYMDGRIDEVGFWKRVLTDWERSCLWNKGNGRTYPLPATCP